MQSNRFNLASIGCRDWQLYRKTENVDRECRTMRDKRPLFRASGADRSSDGQRSVNFNCRRAMASKSEQTLYIGQLKPASVRWRYAMKRCCGSARGFPFCSSLDKITEAETCALSVCMEHQTRWPPATQRPTVTQTHTHTHTHKLTLDTMLCADAKSQEAMYSKVPRSHYQKSPNQETNEITVKHISQLDPDIVSSLPEDSLYVLASRGC
jgi:hypothetical protein